MHKCFAWELSLQMVGHIPETIVWILGGYFWDNNTNLFIIEKLGYVIKEIGVCSLVSWVEGIAGFANEYWNTPPCEGVNSH